MAPLFCGETCLAVQSGDMSPHAKKSETTFRPSLTLRDNPSQMRRFPVATTRQVAKLGGVAPPIATRSLSVKFALLVAATFGVALVALVLVQRTQRQSLADLLEAETRERSRMMERVVELTGQSLRDFTYDYSVWDDMVAFVAAPRREWAAINIDPSLKSFNLAAAWVLRVDGSVAYAVARDNGEPPVLPLADVPLRRVLATNKAANLFLRREDSVFELCLSPVQPSIDTARATPARGWLVAARLWDAAQLKLIGDVLQAEAALAPPGAQPPASEADRVTLHYPLPGPDGVPAANLVYTLRFEELAIAARDQRAVLGLLVGTFLLTAIVMVVFVFRAVVRPLQAVGESLHARDAAPLAPILARHDEIGRVAEAVKTSFEQHAALEAMVAERTRLGRELHDGVIQTVFAAGMNLSGARTVLRVNPADAERILEDTRRELNATIHGLRDFIHRLEPEAQSHRTFREATQAIVTLMQGVRPVRATLEIDDELAAGLTRAQHLHLLRIMREAVSNSVRHGKARHVHLRLARDGAGLLLEITDDGIGLERIPDRENGRGIANFAARAKELGGELQVTAAPNGGLRIRIVVPRV